MLMHVSETATTDAAKVDELVDCARLYSSQLVSSGFLAAKELLLRCVSASCQVEFGGVLCSENAWRDACAHSSCVELRQTIDRLATHSTIQYSDALATIDEHYCSHKEPPEVLLICDVLLGASSLRCGVCGGIVAMYRLGLSSPLLAALWSWQTQYAAIYECWLLSMEYETWAEEQLSDPCSMLNESGLKAASKVQKEMGTSVYYVTHSSIEDECSSCPVCGASFTSIDGMAYSSVCKTCRIATRC